MKMNTELKTIYTCVFLARSQLVYILEHLHHEKSRCFGNLEFQSAVTDTSNVFTDTRTKSDWLGFLYSGEMA